MTKGAEGALSDQGSSDSLMTVYSLLLKGNQFAVCNMHCPPEPLNHSMMASNADAGKDTEKTLYEVMCFIIILLTI